MKKVDKHIKEFKKEYKLSICMIVRDEEKFLEKCLKSLKPLLDLSIAELIIVDTGSIDKTVEIAKKYTDKVYFKKWNNNFSEARNYSISFAKGEYIFIMDADQEMEKEEVNKLIKLFTSEHYKNFNTYSLIYKNFTKEDLSEYVFFSLNLIFKNDGNFRYEGKVHNQPIYKEPIKNLEIYMLHYGYIMTDDIKEKKFKRTATLLKNELKKDPNNIYYIYQLSRSYEMHGDNSEAVIEAEKYLELIEKQNINNNLKVNYYHNAAIIYFNAKKYDKCIEYCEKMKRLDEELIDAHYLIGKSYFIKGDIDLAIKSLKLYLFYLKSFKYEKYANTNGLEVFSFGEKNKVLSELFRLKVKINQLEGIDKYIEVIKKDKEIYMIMVSDILKIYIEKEDFVSVNKVINNLKSENEEILLYYLLSKIIYDVRYENRDSIMELLNLEKNEKEEIKRNINLEKENSFSNLLNFIRKMSKLNKTIKIENCINFFINTLKEAPIDTIEKSNYLNEIIYIIGYLLESSDMIINSYQINKGKLFDLLNKYILLIKRNKKNMLNDDVDFSNKMDDFDKFIKENNILKAVTSLKDAVNIKPKLSNLIEIIKNEIMLKYVEENNFIKEDLIKIKENLITLIDNNMFEEALEILNEIESFYNIKKDIDLLSIKSTLKFYMNEIDESEKILQEGLKYYPNNFDLLYNLAYIYQSKNKKISALSIYYDLLDIKNIGINLDEINNNINKLKEEIEII